MPRLKNRRSLGSRNLALPAVKPKEQYWLAWGRWLFFSSGWLAALFVYVLELPDKIVTFSEKYSPAKEAVLNATIDYKKYVGRFSSDSGAWLGRNLAGDGTVVPDTGDIQLDITYLGDGKYMGEIHSAYMAKHGVAPWSRVSVDGEVGLTGNFQGVVWDIVENTRATYGTFRLTPADISNGSIRLTPTSASKIFPGEVVLWPTEFEMSGGERGQLFYELLHKATSEVFKERESRKREKLK